MAVTRARCKEFIAPSVCATPGCTRPDFHYGAHSNETSIGAKRTRMTPSDAESANKIVTDADRLGAYFSSCKVGQREMFAHLARSCEEPVMYLDAADAALTKLLLARGVAARRLFPVNFKKTVATEIERCCPSVKCLVGDICGYAAAANCNAFGVVWFDMCGTSFGEFDVSELVHCAQHKFYTLSARQLLAAEQQAILCDALLAVGEKLVQRAIYTGLSGAAMNMVFVASKGAGVHKKRCFADDESGGASANARIGIGTVVRFPLSCWPDQSFVDVHGFKTFDDGAFLVGAVHSQVPNSPAHFRLSFQLLSGGSMLCASKYSRAVVQAHAM
jgi:phospholipid N-methyltransferase